MIGVLVFAITSVGFAGYELSQNDQPQVINIEKVEFSGTVTFGSGIEVDEIFGGTSTTRSNVSIGGTLSVTGAVSLTSDLNVNRIVDGGTVTNASSTLTSALTLTAAQVCDSSIISVNSAAVAGTVSAASLDITLPATTTLFADCLTAEGDHTTFWFANLSPTAASTTQIVAGTGLDLLEAGDGSVTNIEIGGLSGARIDIWRHTGLETGTLDGYVTVTEFSPAD